MRHEAKYWLRALAILVTLACEGAAPSRVEARIDEGAMAPGGSAAVAPAPSTIGSFTSGAATLAPEARKARPSCRVMSVSGLAHRAGQLLRAGDELDRQLPVELDADSTVHLVHTESARQWTLTGPARAFACDRGAEEIVLAVGTLRTEPAAGVRPGAEVWVGTPFGSLRYSDARAELRVTPEALRVQVSSGSVWLSLGGGTNEQELTSGTSTYPARPHRLTSATAAARCDGAANQ